MIGPAVLFCPAIRPDRFAKAAQRADLVILDLEDALGASDRPAARVHIAAADLDPERTVIRINAVGSPDHAADLDALTGGRWSHLLLAKTESRSDVDSVVAAIGPGVAVMALIETAAGVLAAAEIAADPSVTGLMWGCEDLAASVGARSARDASGRLGALATHARATVLLAAAAHGKPCIDTVLTEYGNTALLREEAELAAAMGFAGKACIHPDQADVVRTAFRPSADDVRWAREVQAAAAQHPGVFALGGQMIDEPLLRQARRITEQATGESTP